MSNIPTVVGRLVSLLNHTLTIVFGPPGSLFGPGLIPINILSILIRYHPVQVLDEIRHLRSRESLVTTSFVVCDPSFEIHLSWGEDAIEPGGKSWRPGIASQTHSTARFTAHGTSHFTSAGFSFVL